MKIASSALSLQAQHAASSWQQTRQSSRTWVVPSTPAPVATGGQAAQADQAQAIEDATDAVANDPKLSLIRRMLEMLTGQAVRVFDSRQLRGATPPPAPTAAAAVGAEYRYDSVRQESETTTFAAQGTIQTTDGQRIDFHLDMSMARQVRAETHVAIQIGARPAPAPPPANVAGKRKDPLVINFDGNAAQLTDHHFQFDLNGDGRPETLAMLGAGSGYLALDKNGNGTIDSGTELFGPATGSGFAELAKYDQDGNGWIDENDPVFSRLRVWTTNAAGAASLTTLQDRQVGAISLANAATPFELRGKQNGNLGAVRESGVYLSETGQAGTVQDIDLTV
jgi:hypothetical protein